MRIARSDSLILVFSTLVVLASAADIISDLGHGAPATHLAQEGVLMTLAGVLLIRMLLEIRRRDREIAALREDMQRASEAAARSPALAEARARLGEAVSQQFEEWNLTPGEAEVGWLLLKGLSIKEIAALRNTREKTVRQQASSIYRKADLPGRHAFAAWFLEDLL